MVEFVGITKAVLGLAFLERSLVIEEAFQMVIAVQEGIPFMAVRNFDPSSGEVGCSITD